MKSDKKNHNRDFRNPRTLIFGVTEERELGALRGILLGTRIPCPYCQEKHRSEVWNAVVSCGKCGRQFAFSIKPEAVLEVYKLYQEGIGYREDPDNEETAIGWEGECPDT